MAFVGVFGLAFGALAVLSVIAGGLWGIGISVKDIFFKK